MHYKLALALVAIILVPSAEARDKNRLEPGVGCTLAVAPHVAKPGQQVRLSWSVRNATAASILGVGSVAVGPRQSAVVRPDQTQTYQMEVSGPGGTATCDASVAVPQRTEPLHWPPPALAGMPADYLQRARASLASTISKVKLFDDRGWTAYAVASLMFEQDVEAVNRYLANQWESPKHEEFGFGLTSVRSMRLYGLFNERSGTFPGRLTQAAQRRLEEEFYKIASQARFNDYQFASNLENVWSSRGSENHAFCAQSAFLLVSQYLKNSPEFASRTYEDGKTAAEHYEAWRKFWSKLLDERAKRGLYVEVASPSYEHHSREAIQNIRDFAEDPILRQKAEMLLDVTYALAAQETLKNGIRGGAKSRVYTFKDTFFTGGSSRDYELIFGPPGYVGRGALQATSTYFPPPVVLNLGRDVTARGDYAYVQRVPGIGERGSGQTRFDAERSLVRYGFVTPSAVLGSFVLDPNARYAPMSAQNRWQGGVFEGDQLARIAPRVTRLNNSGGVDNEQRVLNGFASLQDRNVLITQRSSSIGDGDKFRVDVYFSPTLDALEELDNWIFVREGQAFAAVRVVGPEGYRWLDPAETKKVPGADKAGKKKSPDVERAAKGNKQKTRKKRPGDATRKEFIALRNSDSPIIIVTGESADYGHDFSRFKSALSQQKIDYDGQTLKFADLVFNGSRGIGSRDGKTVDMSPPRLYDSPFIRSEWESGKIFMRFGGDTLSLDFSDPARPSKVQNSVISSEFPPGVGRAEPIVFGTR